MAGRDRWFLTLALVVAMSISMPAAAGAAEPNDETVAKVKIEEFSVSPLKINAGDEIHLKWQVHNVGSQPVTVRPRVGFGMEERIIFVWADQEPKRLAPGETATFSAAARPKGFRPYPVEHLVFVSVHDMKDNTIINGYVDSRKLMVGRMPAPKQKEPVQPLPAIIAQTERPLYFPGETVSVHGRVVHAKDKVPFVSASGAAGLRSEVSPDGSFSFQFPASGPNGHKLVLQAEGLPATTVDFFVAPDELEFPRLFGTDRTYEVGMFCGEFYDRTPMLPYWANRLGVSFLAAGPQGSLNVNYGTRFDKMLDAADRLGMTVALVNFEAKPAQLSINSDGEKHRYHKNPLELKFQEKFFEQIVDLARRLRHHRSFRYILVMPETFSLRPDTGYGEENLGRFARVLKKERPELQLPPLKDVPAWYQLLREDEQLWDQWLTWRERTWTNFYVRLRDALQAVKPDLDLGTVEANFHSRGLWNLEMLVAEGITAHGPSTWWPIEQWPYWSAVWARDWYRLRYGSEALLSTLSIWWDVNHDPEQIPSGLFGIIKAGGTRIPTWCDTGFRAKWKDLDYEFGQGTVKLEEFAEVKVHDGAQQSPITDMLTGVDGHRKARALEQAAHQIRQLPYKDRFTVYQRHGGKLPLEFAVSWQQDGAELTAKSKDGTAAGEPRDSVYAVVQDWKANGYLEMLLFNDVEQRDRTKRINGMGEAFKAREAFTFEPGSLRKRDLTVTIRSDKVDVMPFLDGRPWLHYKRIGEQLVVESIPFEPQHVRLLQFVDCGRELPHVTGSPPSITHTMLNVRRRQLWLKFAKPEAGEITVHCADWGKPEAVEGGKLDADDAESSSATISVAANARSLVIHWSPERGRE